MSATDLFRHLLVSKDGHIEELDVDHMEHDEQTGAAIAKGLISVPRSNFYQLETALKANTRRILDQMEWTSRSVQARLGMHVHSIDPSDAILVEDKLLMQATFAMFPWENREGHLVENPLPLLLRDWMKYTRIACGRLFLRPLECGSLSKEELYEAVEMGKLHVNGANIMNDSAVMPFYGHERYALRHDLMDPDRLRDAVTGSGRGAIEAIQPRIPEDLSIVPGGYGIGATRCSLLEHRGVLDRPLIDLQTGEVRLGLSHGTSTLWDGGKTTGIEHSRHLEVHNVSSDEVAMRNYGVRLHVYPALHSNGIVSKVLSASSSHVQKKGLSLDHYLPVAEHQQNLRNALSRIQNDPDMWGMLIGADGLLPVRQERHMAQQDMAVSIEAERYSRVGGKEAKGDWEDMKDICELMAYMGDPRQRAVLLCKQTPSADAIKRLMERGVRTVVTDNIAGNEEKMYVNDAQIKSYRRLADEGLNLYLVMPSHIRKLWKYLFVKIDSLDQVQETDLRICIYCASADGADVLLEKAKYPEFLERMRIDYPRMSIVTGASKNGAMHYANRVASDLGITTIGIANHIIGQETTEEDLDAAMFFDQDGFNPRQELMARIGTCPFIGPGAQGSEFEGALERAHLKIAKSTLPPVIYIDPLGLGPNGTHWWSPVADLERRFAESLTIPAIDRTIQMSRSPYVRNLTHFESTYLESYEHRLKPFLQDPLGIWQKSGVPDQVIRTAMQRAVRDAKFTGLPIPIHLKGVIQELGIDMPA